MLLNNQLHKFKNFIQLLNSLQFPARGHHGKLTATFIYHTRRRERHGATRTIKDGA
jgi:hypothetical protein